MNFACSRLACPYKCATSDALVAHYVQAHGMVLSESPFETVPEKSLKKSVELEKSDNLVREINKKD